MTAIAKPDIPPAPRREILHFNWGNTGQIMQVIMAVANKEHLGSQVARFSESFRASAPAQQYEKLGELWAYVKGNIPYVPDPAGVQQVKHPARTWEDAERGEGSDCKSLSVFVRFVLYNLGVPHFLRFASYIPSKRIQHVYVVALLDGREVILDTVHSQFDDEVSYTHKKDKKPERMTKIVEISGLPANIEFPERPWFPILQMTDGELALAAAIRELELVATINKARGFRSLSQDQEKALDQLGNILQNGLHRADIKKAPASLQAALNRLQRQDWPSYEGFSHQPRRAAIAGEFDPTPEQESYCREEANRRYGNCTSGSLSQISACREQKNNWIQQCLEEAGMENVVNAHLVDAGPNFLYDQMGPDNSFRGVITVKQLNQSAWIYEAARTTGLSENNVRAIARTGTVEKIGETPESAKQILYPAMTTDNIGDLIAIAALISAIVAVVSAGVRLVQAFQQQSQFQQAFRNIEDPGSPLFKIAEGDFAIPVDDQGNPTGGGPGGGGSGGGGGTTGGTNNNDLLKWGLLGAGAYLFLS